MHRLLLPLLAATLMATPVMAAQCPPAGMAMDAGGEMDMAPADDAHKALMAGMDKMDADMDGGGTAADIDVAFICAMIPHHQGAIDMAKAELAYGDDPWAKALAEKIIAAQTDEIAQMHDWVSKQP